jgi:hypothetical protein
MSWLDRLRGVEKPDLIGRWVSDPDDASGIAEFGRTTLEFRPSGQLAYTIHAEDRDQIMFLTYRVVGEYLVTDQSSAPREDRTKFSVSTDGKLQLNYGSGAARYVRIPEQ